MNSIPVCIRNIILNILLSDCFVAFTYRYIGEWKTVDRENEIDQKK